MTDSEHPDRADAIGARTRKAAGASRWPRRLVPLAALIVIVGVLILPPVRRLLTGSAGPAPTGVAAEPGGKSFEEAWAASRRVDVGVPPDGAKVVVLLFNDWLCLPCEAALVAYQPILDAFAKTNPGAVKFVIKDFPWDPACNPAVTTALNPGACEAAAAVRMARLNGKAQDLIDWLSANRGNLTLDSVKAAAASVGGVSRFESRYPDMLALIRRDAADGRALDVRATPSLFINGVRAREPGGGLLLPQHFERALELEGVGGVFHRSGPNGARGRTMNQP